VERDLTRPLRKNGNLMSLQASGRYGGIHAATVVPLRNDFSIDDKALAEHIARVASVPGISGLLVNGHAGENFLLSPAEKRRVVEVAREAAPRSCLIVSGVNSESSLEAAAHARDAQEAGADAIMVFPPNGWALFQEESTAVVHHRYVQQATRLPIFIYQAPVGAGAMAYKLPVLQALIDLPNVVAIKEGSWEVATYEEHRRFVKDRRPEIAVLGSGDEHLLTSYLIGSEGSQVSLAAVVPGLVVSLWNSASAGDWEAAKAQYELIYPLAVAIYRRAPSGRATARLKTCLRLLGHLSSDRVRPPLLRVPDDEIAGLERALAASGTL
jgi:4-hydroxy-tetrahydrodipicolinate synthase